VRFDRNSGVLDGPVDRRGADVRLRRDVAFAAAVREVRPCHQGSNTTDRGESGRRASQSQAGTGNII